MRTNVDSPKWPFPIPPSTVYTKNTSSFWWPFEMEFIQNVLYSLSRYRFFSKQTLASLPSRFTDQCSNGSWFMRSCNKILITKVDFSSLAAFWTSGFEHKTYTRYSSPVILHRPHSGKKSETLQRDNFYPGVATRWRRKLRYCPPFSLPDIGNTFSVPRGRLATHVVA
jgi:hypothetical protein